MELHMHGACTSSPVLLTILFVVCYYCVQRVAVTWMIFIQSASASYYLLQSATLSGCSALIGGCDDLVALHKSGALQPKLEKALIHQGKTGIALPLAKSSAPAASSPSSAVDNDQSRPARSLFWFPDVVDNRCAWQ